MNPPLRVCLIGLKCYDHISGAPVPRYLGGIETQLAVLAKGLVRQGCEVSLITYDHGQRDAEVFDGVTVYKSFRPDAGLPGLRTLHPRSTGLWRAMRRADADLYLQMGAGAETGQTARGCAQLPAPRRPFVFCMASDANFGAHLHAGRMGIEGRIYRYGLRRADRIIAQTIRQQEGLLQATGLKSEVIPMAVLPPFQRLSGESPATPPHVLWVGRVTPEKRLEWLLEAARRCPQVIFDIVGAPNRESDYAAAVLAEAAALPNVRVHGRASNDQLAALYRMASILCCTSTLEGFPTTFLEAWSVGIPVVTTFDPDAVVARHGLGKVAASLDEFVAHLESLLRDPALHSQCAADARRYCLANHAPDTVSARFLRLFQQLVRDPAAASSVVEPPSPTPAGTPSPAGVEYPP